MAVDGDVDDGIERPSDLGLAIGLDGGPQPGDELVTGPARDEHAVAETVARLVRRR